MGPQFEGGTGHLKLQQAEGRLVFHLFKELPGKMNALIQPVKRISVSHLRRHGLC